MVIKAVTAPAITLLSGCHIRMNTIIMPSAQEHGAGAAVGCVRDAGCGMQDVRWMWDVGWAEPQTPAQAPVLQHRETGTEAATEQ